MNGVNQVSFGDIPGAGPNSNPGWRVVGAADLNGDGKPDLLWQNRNDNSVAYWIMNGVNQVSFGDIPGAGPNSNPGWQLVEALDINGDGKPDLIWQNRTDNSVAYWMMNGVRQVSFGDFPGAGPNSNLEWLLAAAPRVRSGLATVDVSAFGAACDGSTADNYPFQLASDYAQSAYLATGKTTNITVGHGKTGVCNIASEVYVRPGTHFVGTGGGVQAVGTLGESVFKAPGGSDIGFDHMQITGSTSSVTGAILYQTAPSNTDGPYQNFSITNSVIHGTAYAVRVLVYDYPDQYAYKRRLNNVNISTTSVDCNGYQFDPACRDAIHVSGEAFQVQIMSNTVKERADAAYALTSAGAPTLAQTISTFGSMWPVLTPTNVTISNNTGSNVMTCLDFSGGNKVFAQNNTCVDTVPIPAGPKMSGPSLRFIWGGYFPLPSNITVSGGTFSNNVSAGPADTSNVKMDFSGYGVNGEYPVCNCIIENHAQIGGPLSGLVWMQGNTFTIDNSGFAANTRFYVEAEVGVATNKVIVSNSFWSSPRYIIPTSIPGGISNSYLINDSYNGKTTSSTAIKYPWREP
jgi:hypothetical protein